MDDTIDSKQVSDIRNRWGQLKTAAGTFVCCFEYGNFDAVRDAFDTKKSA